MRILVIDDDRSVSAAIEASLHRQGCEVVLVENGRLGIRAFETSNFDAVMVDIFMPEMDGLETIRRFRRQAPTVPIIAMSGFRFRDSRGGAAPDFLSIAATLGATYCLRKPFGPEQLMAAVSSHLEPDAKSDALGGQLRRDLR